MTRRTKRVSAIAVVAVCLTLTGGAVAALLGNLLGFPMIVFASGTTDIASGRLDVTSAPLALRLSASSVPVFVNPTAAGYETVRFSAIIDGACGLVGGVSGDDLEVVGKVDLGGGDVREGILLTGEVMQFGFAEGGATDLFDFRYSISGGLLADQFGIGENLGILVQSESSTFDGNCGQVSAGQAKGTIGAIPPILPTEGCTPGYWKQAHHFDSWLGYAPSDDFATVFGRTVAGVSTLESGLKTKGGGVDALARHAVAALLNAAHGGVNADPDYNTAAEVIAAFQAAFDSGDYELLKNELEAANESGCPLN